MAVDRYGQLAHLDRHVPAAHRCRHGVAVRLLILVDCSIRVVVDAVRLGRVQAARWPQIEAQPGDGDQRWVRESVPVARIGAVIGTAVDRAGRISLPAHLHDALDGTSAFHSGKIFGPDTPDSVHPAIRTHDESGRKALYLNLAFTRHLVDVDPDVSKAVIMEAMLHATRVEFVYRHRWVLYDLVIWDNRSVLHCPSLDYEGERYMHRAVVAGGAPV